MTTTTSEDDRLKVISQSARAAANSIMDAVGNCGVVIIVRTDLGQSVISNASGILPALMMLEGADAIVENRNITTPIAKVN
jgi:hypothetical protein